LSSARQQIGQKQESRPDVCTNFLSVDGLHMLACLTRLCKYSFFVQVWEVDPAKHEPGSTIHTVGWPLDRQTYGGSFIYHMADNQVRLHSQSPSNQTAVVLVSLVSARLMHLSYLDSGVGLAIRSVLFLHYSSVHVLKKATIHLLSPSNFTRVCQHSNFPRRV
jgi:hypothetical protein